MDIYCGNEIYYTVDVIICKHSEAFGQYRSVRKDKEDGKQSI